MFPGPQFLPLVSAGSSWSGWLCLNCWSSTALSISEKLGTLVGYGFNGICVAAIGVNHPVGVIFAAIFLGGVLSSRSYMQMFLGVAPEITDVIAGVIVLILALPELSRMFLRWRRKKVIA